VQPCHVNEHCSCWLCWWRDCTQQVPATTWLSAACTTSAVLASFCPGTLLAGLWPGQAAACAGEGGLSTSVREKGRAVQLFRRIVQEEEVMQPQPWAALQAGRPWPACAACGARCLPLLAGARGSRPASRLCLAGGMTFPRTLPECVHCAGAETRCDVFLDAEALHTTAAQTAEAVASAVAAFCQGAASVTAVAQAAANAIASVSRQRWRAVWALGG